jgi:hypothetical protein
MRSALRQPFWLPWYLRTLGKSAPFDDQNPPLE